MKQKALAFVMAAVMALTSLPATAFASKGFEWHAEVSKSDVKVGDVFYLDFKVTENPGVNNATIFINYNGDVVKPVAYTAEQEPADMLVYQSRGGAEFTLFDYENISGRAQDSVARGNNEIRIANYISEADENLSLKEMNGTGTLLRIAFEAVGEGKASLVLDPESSVARTPKKYTGNMADYINLPEVTVGTGANVSTTASTTATTETTTEIATETTTATEVTTKVTNTTQTTTKAPSSGGFVGGIRPTTTTKATTTTTTKVEPTTEATTKAVETKTEPTTSAFTDMANHPWAIEYVNFLSECKIVNGYSDGTFKPGNNVKRADFLIMLMNLLNTEDENGQTVKVDNYKATPTDQIPEGTPASLVKTDSDGKSVVSPFTDVTADKYYFDAVAAAHELGIASGKGDGTFDPESFITRQDMMILAKKALEIKAGREVSGDLSELNRFIDKDSISPYAKDSLAAMVNVGIVKGSEGKLNPKSNTTRAEAAVVISNVYSTSVKLS